jgi:hypothetical protein
MNNQLLNNPYEHLLKRPKPIKSTTIRQSVGNVATDYGFTKPIPKSSRTEQITPMVNTNTGYLKKPKKLVETPPTKGDIVRRDTWKDKLLGKKVRIGGIETPAQDIDKILDMKFKVPQYDANGQVVMVNGKPLLKEASVKSMLSSSDKMFRLLNTLNNTNQNASDVSIKLQVHLLKNMAWSAGKKTRDETWNALMQSGIDPKTFYDTLNIPLIFRINPLVSYVPKCLGDIYFYYKVQFDIDILDLDDPADAEQYILFPSPDFYPRNLIKYIIEDIFMDIFQIQITRNQHIALQHIICFATALRVSHLLKSYNDYRNSEIESYPYDQYPEINDKVRAISAFFIIDTFLRVVTGNVDDNVTAVEYCFSVLKDFIGSHTTLVNLTDNNISFMMNNWIYYENPVTIYNVFSGAGGDVINANIPRIGDENKEDFGDQSQTEQTEDSTQIDEDEDSVQTKTGSKVSRKSQKSRKSRSGNDEKENEVPQNIIEDIISEPSGKSKTRTSTGLKNIRAMNQFIAKQNKRFSPFKYGDNIDWKLINNYLKFNQEKQLRNAFKKIYDLAVSEDNSQEGFESFQDYGKGPYAIFSAMRKGKVEVYLNPNTSYIELFDTDNIETGFV